MGGYFEKLLSNPYGKISDISDGKTVMIDIDKKAVWRLNKTFKLIYRLCHLMRVVPQWIRTDSTRRGWHVIVRWPYKLLESELCAIQHSLGSDPDRERLNIMRAVEMRRNPELASNFWRARFNILYEVKI